MKEWLEPEEHILTDGEKIDLHSEREEYTYQVGEALTEDVLQIGDYEFLLSVESVEINDEDDTYDIDIRYTCMTDDELNGVYHFDELEFGCSPKEAGNAIRTELEEWIEID